MGGHRISIASLPDVRLMRRDRRQPAAWSSTSSLNRTRTRPASGTPCASRRPASRRRAADSQAQRRRQRRASEETESADVATRTGRRPSASESPWPLGWLLAELPARPRRTPRGVARDTRAPKHPQQAGVTAALDEDPHRGRAARLRFARNPVAGRAVLEEPLHRGEHRLRNSTRLTRVAQPVRHRIGTRRQIVTAPVGSLPSCSTVLRARVVALGVPTLDPLGRRVPADGIGGTRARPIAPACVRQPPRPPHTDRLHDRPLRSRGRAAG